MLKKKKIKKHCTYSVRDVSHYIIVYSNERDYGVSNLKLQKLLYLVQAFFLINDYPPCFDEKFDEKNIWNTERIYYEDVISDDDKEINEQYTVIPFPYKYIREYFQIS